MAKLGLGARLYMMAGLAIVAVLLSVAVFLGLKNMSADASDDAARRLDYATGAMRTALSMATLQTAADSAFMHQNQDKASAVAEQLAAVTQGLDDLAGRDLEPAWDAAIADLQNTLQENGNALMTALEGKQFDALPDIAGKIGASTTTLSDLSIEAEASAQGAVAYRTQLLQQATIFSVVLSVIIIVAALAISRSIIKSIRAPIRELLEASRLIQDKQFDAVVLPPADQTEIGQLTLAVKGYLDSEIDSEEKAASLEQSMAESKKRQDARDALIKQLNDNSRDLIAETRRAGDSLVSLSSALDGQAETGEKTAATAGQSAENSMQAVDAVASAATELSASINEISGQVRNALETVNSSVDLANASRERVTALIEQAGAIGAVSDIIRQISEQTNLLALNATVEAARAGDAGKGFAVVASEVKDLARQIETQTEQIAASVRAIQATSRDTAGAMDEIVSSINVMAGVNQSIAASVEEQSAATGEISQTATTTASDVRQINEMIGQVASISAETRSASVDMRQATDSSVQSVTRLRQEVEQFLDGMAKV